MKTMNMNKTTIAAIVIGVVVVGGLIVFMAMGPAGQPGATSGIGNVTSSVGTPVAGEPSSATRAAVPTGVVVPGTGAQDVPAGVAVPQVVTPAAPGVAANLRAFTMTETASAFTPDTVVVKSGDTVDISITATGGNRDFTQPDYGLSLAIASGATRKLEFQATAVGKFTFYCASCGGPDKGPVGYIIVTAK